MTALRKARPGIFPATVLEAGLWLLFGFVVLFMALVIALTVFMLGLSATGNLDSFGYW